MQTVRAAQYKNTNKPVKKQVKTEIATFPKKYRWLKDTWKDALYHKLLDK